MSEETISRIPVMPFAMMLAAIQAVISFITGIIIALIWAPFISYAQSMPNYTGPPLGFFGILFGVGAVVIFPILGFVIGLIEGLLFAVIYNFLAPRIGGIRLQFE